MVFNCRDDSESLQEHNDYEHLLCYRGDVDIDIIRKLSGMLDDRFHITEPKGKAFLKTRDPRSVAFMKRSGKLLKFNESELYFESCYKMPMWTCFVLTSPFEALLPFFQRAVTRPNFILSQHIYRAFINGVGESEKRNHSKARE